MRLHFGILAGSLIFLSPVLAWAQEGDCPPGGWFCEETPPPETEPGSDTPDEPESDAPDSPPVEKPKTRTTHIVIDQTEDVPPKPRRRPYRRLWGINLRLEGLMMGSSDKRSQDAGMGGLGSSFRYRPIHHFAFDVGVDFFGGRDWQGNDRSETALLFNGLIYFNPKDAVQVYTLAGIGFSSARVKPNDTTLANGQQVSAGDVPEQDYTYFGGQLGLGLEFRVSHKVSLNLDLVGFIRGRTDEKARTQPEFTDPDTGRTTNTSGGGLFRGGITFYW